MNLLKRFINNFFLLFGYHLVRSDFVKNTLSFQNLHNLINTYEFLFQKYRNHEIILDNTNRSEFMAKLLGTPPSEAYFIIEAISRTKNIPGDVCEFGIAQGETSALIANEIRDTNKKLHLFDSFEGLPKPTEKDKLKDDIFSLGSIEKYEGTMNCKKQMVIKRLKEISFEIQRYFIHEGFIEELIHQAKNFPQKVSFAYIDFDFYEPVLITLNFLHDVTPKGGIFIVDDYDFFSTGVKTAVDEFINDKNSTDKYYDIEIPEKCFGCFAILFKLK